MSEEQKRITTAIALPGESVGAVMCPSCGDEIELLPERMGMPLWVGDPVPAVCPACQANVTLRLAYIEVVTAQASTAEHADAEAAHLEQVALTLDHFAEHDPVLASMLGKSGDELRRRATEPAPPFCTGARVGFNCRPNAGGVDHHAHCPQGAALAAAQGDREQCCDGIGYCREHNPGGRLA